MGDFTPLQIPFVRGTRLLLVFLGVALILPVVDAVLPEAFRTADLMRPIFIYAIMGLGLNVVTGFTGLLNLGCAAFMAIGAYAYAILTCENYPYRIGFWPAVAVTPLIGAAAGLLLGSPTLRLRGDYIAIVTLGFGEIVQDLLKNLDTITKGTQGINPLPPPSLFGYTFTPAETRPWYYLFLGMVAVLVILNRNLENSRLGRAWIAIREDELAASCMGINPVRTKLFAFGIGAAFCSLAGALWVSMLGTSGEPSTYDFSVSIITLCIVIVGGMGSIVGVLLGALIVNGLDSIVLDKLSDVFAHRGWASSDNVFTNPASWKFMIFGLGLVLMMRFKPEGFLPSRRVKAEIHH